MRLWRGRPTRLPDAEARLSVRPQRGKPRRRGHVPPKSASGIAGQGFRLIERFHDRRHGGRVLARALSAYERRADVLVLALPRGGVPVAYEVAEALGARLDVFVVRKLGVPGEEEVAMGAIASGGVRVMNEDIV